MVLNKFVRPHKVHQGHFWPSKAIFGSNVVIWGFRTFLALKISNKRVAQFFLIPPAFLHLKWWNRYIFDVQGSKLAINSKNRAKMAKIGYTHMANLLKKHILWFASKWPLEHLKDQFTLWYWLGRWTPLKKFHHKQKNFFGPGHPPTGRNWQARQEMLWKGSNCPKTLLTCIIYDIKSSWPTLGPFRYPRRALKGPFGPGDPPNQGQM